MFLLDDFVLLLQQTNVDYEKNIDNYAQNWCFTGKWKNKNDQFQEDRLRKLWKQTQISMRKQRNWKVKRKYETKGKRCKSSNCLAIA